MPQVDALTQSRMDQVDLLLARCGYAKYVVDDIEGDELDVVYRNIASKRQQIIMMTERGEVCYTFPQTRNIPTALVTKHDLSTEIGAKFIGAEKVLNLYLDLTQIAMSAGVDPIHTASALDLYAYHAYGPVDQSTGYTLMLRLLAETRLGYRNLQALLVGGMPIEEIRAYGGLNPALVKDLLRTA